MENSRARSKQAEIQQCPIQVTVAVIAADIATAIELLLQLPS